MQRLQQNLEMKGVIAPEVSEIQRKLESSLKQIRARGEQERRSLYAKASLGLGPRGAGPETPEDLIKAQKTLATNLKGADVIAGESLSHLEGTPTEQGTAMHPNLTKRVAAYMTEGLPAEKALNEVKAEDYKAAFEQDEFIAPEMKGRSGVPLFDPAQVNDVVAEMDPKNQDAFDEEGLFASFDDIIGGLTDDGWDYDQIKMVIQKLISFREERVRESSAATPAPPAETAVAAFPVMPLEEPGLPRRLPRR